MGKPTRRNPKSILDERMETRRFTRGNFFKPREKGETQRGELSEEALSRLSDLLRCLSQFMIHE